LDEKQLIEKLEYAGINVSLFGTGSAKTLGHLLSEVNSGECKLESRGKRLVRVVELLGVDVYYQHTSPSQGRLRLIEMEQVFIDGRTRRRNLSTTLGEKLESGEKPNKKAVRRAITQELGIQGNLEIRRPWFNSSKETRPTLSYPGLECGYTTYKFEVFLNNDQYNPEGYEEKQWDKTTYFKWTKG
jgi:hypothetical protein